MTTKLNMPKKEINAIAKKQGILVMKGVYYDRQGNVMVPVLFEDKVFFKRETN